MVKIEMSTTDELIEEVVRTTDHLSFYVADLGEVERQYAAWMECLPQVRPYYAIKCNPSPGMLTTINALGGGFDCASKAEIEAVLHLGIDASDIIYANPCKPESHLRFAKESGVEMMTFDNQDELLKIQRVYPQAKLLIRLLADDEFAAHPLGAKFGASAETTLALLQTAKQLNLDVIGCSFHVGSGCSTAMIFHHALEFCKTVCDQGAGLGFNMKLIDIGGGFPGRLNIMKGVTLGDIAKVVTKAMDDFFDSSYTFISEPGRYFCSSAFTLVTTVTSRRRVQVPGKASFMYYLGDGVYGAFNMIVNDHIPAPTPTIVGESMDIKETHESSLWGPTCDSLDCIVKGAQLPEMEVGTWLKFYPMGAYTLACAASFNGFSPAPVYYVSGRSKSVGTGRPIEEMES